jgi:hypothetical protein
MRNLVGRRADLSRIHFLILCSALTLHSTAAWSYLDQDEDVWWVSLLALGVLIVIFIVIYCTKEVDSFLSPIHPYIPRDGTYVAEYREPDGIGKRNVYLTFDGDEEKGWKILHQGKGVKMDEIRALVVTGGYVDPSGKMWWREEGPGTAVESYGRYDLSKGTFAGTWAATHSPRDQEGRSSDPAAVRTTKDQILVAPSNGVNVRRVKYTSFYHSQSYPPTVPKPKSRYGKSKDLSKLALDYTAMEDGYINVTGPDDNDAVLVARQEMTTRNPSTPNRPGISRGDIDPPAHGSKSYRNRAGQAAARIFSKFDKSSSAIDRTPSPDPDYIRVDEAMSFAPVGNDDATVNSEFAPNLRHDNTFQTNESNI